jgi:hypothetical protein
MREGVERYATDDGYELPIVARVFSARARIRGDRRA